MTNGGRRGKTCEEKMTSDYEQQRKQRQQVQLPIEIESENIN